MEAILDCGWIFEMLVESVNILENTAFATDNQIVDGDDVLAVFGQANAADVLSYCRQ